MTHKDTPDNGEAPKPGPSTAPESGNPSPEGEMGDAVATLEAEKAELKERLLRSLAEMENLRRRSEREASDAKTYAVTNFARDMLTVADNIRRAIESAPGEEGERAEAMRPLMEGIELTEKDLLKTLQRHGVRPIEAEGSKFDPNRHQAMFELPSEDLPGGTVVKVVQNGYVIGDRVLRPALVGVAKAAPKPAAAAPERDAGEPPATA